MGVEFWGDLGALWVGWGVLRCGRDPLILPTTRGPGAHRGSSPGPAPSVSSAPPRRQGALSAPCRSRRADRECSVAAQAQSGGWEKMAATSFEQMGLDARLLRAVAELGWAAPTAIQAEAVPLALEGRDLLARARTGSGKTAAYGLPLLQRLLRVKAVSGAGGTWGTWAP
ncbi:ATP-dependent RNA helicase DBP9-like [Numida meleagris]|uniref:ATP-dependent RNA helicase DBP9-like n=1 Tax=Numida meleagris TaxID=8996 RepID=UPI000B3DAC1E|nr:ATP-dependent RNA helicase DBP9-like [Numida meleagris]